MRERAEANPAGRLSAEPRPTLLKNRAFLAIAALVVVGLGLRAWNASHALEELLRTTLPDDAFYYFGIARHIILGHPPSIDGISPTNGYHPLWLALLVPVYWLCGPEDVLTPIRVAVVLGAVLDAASSFLLWQIARRMGLGTVGIALALLFFIANPHQVVNATCGLETALALFTLLLAVALHVRARTSQPPAVPNSWRWGVILGLALLSRTDNAIVVGCLVASNLRLLWRSTGLRPALTWAASTTATALVVYLPWPVYSLYTTGTVVQSSGLALSFIHRQMSRVWGIEQPSFSLSAARVWASVLESAELIVQWCGLTAIVAANLALVALVNMVWSHGALAGDRTPTPAQLRGVGGRI